MRGLLTLGIDLKLAGSPHPVNLLSLCFGYCSPLVQWDCKWCILSDESSWVARGHGIVLFLAKNKNRFLNKLGRTPWADGALPTLVGGTTPIVRYVPWKLERLVGWIWLAQVLDTGQPTNIEYCFYPAGPQFKVDDPYWSVSGHPLFPGRRTVPDILSFFYTTLIIWKLQVYLYVAWH